MDKCKGAKITNQVECPRTDSGALNPPPPPPLQRRHNPRTDSGALNPPPPPPLQRRPRPPPPPMGEATEAYEQLLQELEDMAPSDVELIPRPDMVLQIDALVQARSDIDRLSKKGGVFGQNDRKDTTPKGYGERDSWMEVVGVAEVRAPARAAEYVMRRRAQRTQNKCREQPPWVRDLWSDTLLAQQGDAIAEVPRADATALDELQNALEDNTVNLGHLQSHANEAFLWSGTDVVSLILRNGFDASWASDGGLYGAGIYLTESPPKFDQYASPYIKGENIFAVPLARTTLGRILGSFRNPVLVPWHSRAADVMQGPGFSKGLLGTPIGKGRDTLRGANFVASKRASLLTDEVANEFLKYFGDPMLPSSRKRNNWKADDNWKAKRTLSTAHSLVGLDVSSGRNDGNEFLVYNGAAIYAQYIIFYKRRIADEGKDAPDISEETTRAMSKFILRHETKIFGSWAFPRRIPRKFDVDEKVEVLRDSNIRGPVRLFPQFSAGKPGSDTGNMPAEIATLKNPAFLYVLDSYGFLVRAFMLPVEFNGDELQLSIPNGRRRLSELSPNQDDASLSLDAPLKLSSSDATEDPGYLSHFFQKINEMQTENDAIAFVQAYGDSLTLEI